MAPNSDKLGFTEPNAAGRTYRHGTISGYSTGKSKCRHRKDAYAIYRAERHAAGKDSPELRTPATPTATSPATGSESRSGSPPSPPPASTSTSACTACATPTPPGSSPTAPTFKSSRNAWASIATTEKYLHTLPDADDTALDAFTRIRTRAFNAVLFLLAVFVAWSTSAPTPSEKPLGPVMTFELGLYSFGNTPLLADGGRGPTAQAVRDVLEAIKLADEVGLDFFGVGEHHMRTMPLSSPTAVVNAAAASTSRIKLSTAVTVLSTDDPIRVFQQLATAASIRPEIDIEFHRIIAMNSGNPVLAGLLDAFASRTVRAPCGAASTRSARTGVPTENISRSGRRSRHAIRSGPGSEGRTI
ncbi:LLM class flavin-dependent oxidoreductase [Thermocatellispora tengchongensis]|uniref:LLM class flavin-dependent oxidoreductase n=1 Tax=Thermocatellispora tengchongensis TaxID=1073253 RepID=UPI00362E0A08